MIVVQSEACSIAVETLTTPHIEVQIEDIENEGIENNTVQEVTEPALGLLSDTEYNGSAESNNSSRRSSVDVPHFELCSLNLNRNHRRANNYDDDRHSEVGRL